MEFVPYLAIITLLVNYVNGDPDRIAGGKPIKKDEYEYFVQLLIGAEMLPNRTVLFVRCGASIIHPLWLLTAGHCFKMETFTPPEMFTDGWVRAFTGSKKVVESLVDTGFIVRNVKEAHVHPEYIFKMVNNNHHVVNDVAIAKLKKPFKRNVKTINLPLAGKEQLCNSGTIVGGGDVKEEELSQLVQYSPIQRKNKDQLVLKPLYGSSTVFYSEVKWYDGHPLRGDSGGPFVCGDRVYPVQYGIISLNVKNSELEVVLSVYESVEKHMSFIKKYVPLDRDSYHKKEWRVNREQQVDKSNSLQGKISFIGLYINIFLHVIQKF